VTIAIRRSWSRRDGEGHATDFGKTEAKYFSRDIWTVESTLNCFMNFDFSRIRSRDGLKGKTSAIDVANNTSDLPVEAGQSASRPHEPGDMRVL
jgi:hypothetical protein